jgi:hypothetical protein
MKLTRKQAKEYGIPMGDRKSPAAEEGLRRRIAKKRVDACPHSIFDAMCKSHGLPVAVHEFEFALPRRWRFDHVFDGWLALEVQGGLFVEGRHSRGAALLCEHEKLNLAVIHGYSVMFCTPDDVSSGRIFPIIKRALDAHGEQP